MDARPEHVRIWDRSLGGFSASGTYVHLPSQPVTFGLACVFGLNFFFFTHLQLNLNLGGKKAALAKGSKGKKAPTTWLGRLSEALNPATWLVPRTAIDTGEAWPQAACSMQHGCIGQ